MTDALGPGGVGGGMVTPRTTYDYVVTSPATRQRAHLPPLHQTVTGTVMALWLLAGCWLRAEEDAL